MTVMNARRAPRWFYIVIFFALLVRSSLVAAAPDGEWKNFEEEAVSLLSRYIQIDTTNPPGNEIKAAQFFKGIFDREGIESRIIESAPGRGNIYARLKGNGSKKAVLLLNHMDVVPAEAKLWKEPPFSGVVKDGTIWGRGSLDDKGPAVAELMTLLALKRGNVHLKGDVIFLGTADEEAGGAMGAGFLVEKHPDLLKDVGLVLNEGGGIRLGNEGARVQRQRYRENSFVVKTHGHGCARPWLNAGKQSRGQQVDQSLAWHYAVSESHQSCSRSSEVLR
jgi:acetylornithine deacetylase/succinyl-diaminopimelate desuccinylase-like protein